MSSPLIRFDRVTYEIGPHTLIRNVSFEVQEGECLVLLGESGSGKTTLLKLINHLLVPTSGDVHVFQKSTREWDPIRLRRKIGYVIQDVGLFPHFTVYDNIALVPTLEKWSREAVGKRVAEVMQLVGLDFEAFAARVPSELSGGQRQRVGVARALCADPPVLLMDEPFGALDLKLRSEIQTEFHQLQKKLGKTTVFVTHDLAEALIFGDRIGLVAEGELAILADKGIFLGSTHPAVKSFLRPAAVMKRLLEEIP